jgi:hypothetical protein
VSVRIEQRGDAVRLTVRVQPRASRSEIAGVHGDALRVRLAAPPVDGEANLELVRFLARQVGISRSRVRIVTGETARLKVVEFEDVQVDAVRAALGLDDDGAT